MTKERLRRYRDLKKEKAQIEGILQRMEPGLYGPKIPQLTGMPSGQPNGSPIEGPAIRHVELEARYRALLAELDTEILAVEEAIASLPSRLRTLMRHYYIEGMTWEEVCVAISYSWRQTHNLHAEALSLLKEKEI